MRTIWKESSLNRLYYKMEEHDCGTITASREKDMINGKLHYYTYKENKQRNRSLLAKLQALSYGVTNVRGSYIENFNTPDAVEVSENVFFVEDQKDLGALKEDLMELGEMFNQDSVLYIPRGGLNGILIGTNKAPFPGYHKEIDFSNRSFGKTGEFMTKVKNRPFMFESIIQEYQESQGYLGKQALFKIARMDWKDIEV